MSNPFENPSDNVTISLVEYEQLKDDALKLAALQEAGVDNWSWYGDAMDQYRAWKEEANDKDVVDPDGEADAT
jgi:hypothetical protein